MDFGKLRVFVIERIATKALKHEENTNRRNSVGKIRGGKRKEHGIEFEEKYLL